MIYRYWLVNFRYWFMIYRYWLVRCVRLIFSKRDAKIHCEEEEEAKCTFDKWFSLV